ncbi:MAG: serine/threonine protein kinase, partial [Thermoguttaceae bacterium]
MQIERLGPYRITGKLGRGGMGTVYQAVNLQTGEPAAIKLLSAALAREEGFRERFEAEIETLKKLNHPGIVRLFGFGEQDDQLFYAMELIKGNSLEEELSRGRRFDWREVVRLAIDICRALRHAHDRGVIHRDIKPGNLLLADDAQIKLSDFGIAKLFGNTRLTSAGSVLGTAEYMAPEQAAGKVVDLR